MLYIALVTLLKNYASASMARGCRSGHGSVVGMGSGMVRFRAKGILVNSISHLCVSGGYLLVTSRGSISGRVRVFGGGSFDCLADVKGFKRKPRRVAIVKYLTVSRTRRRLCISSRTGRGVFDCSVSDMVISSLCGPRMGATVGRALFPSRCRCVGSALSVTMLVGPADASAFGRFLNE